MTLPPRRALTSLPVASQSAGQNVLCVGLLTPHSPPTAGLQWFGETFGPAQQRGRETRAERGSRSAGGHPMR